MVYFQDFKSVYSRNCDSREIAYLGSNLRFATLSGLILEKQTASTFCLVFVRFLFKSVSIDSDISFHSSRRHVSHQV
jgi:hypothetical protein